MGGLNVKQEPSHSPKLAATVYEQIFQPSEDRPQVSTGDPRKMCDHEVVMIDPLVGPAGLGRHSLLLIYKEISFS